MQPTDSFATWVESTRLALMIGESMWIIASLSAIHLLGFTLTLGGAFVLNARLAGGMLLQVPVRDVAGPASRSIAIGLAISITSGILLASWKLGTVLPGGIFQIKMSFLAAAALLHFAWQRPRLRKESDGAGLRAMGILGLVLWFGLAAAGCAFILFE